jgi:hypothetical protein
MKQYILKIFLYILCASSLAACKKQLNVFPTTSEVDGNVITDESSAVSTLNGVYYCFANGGADYNQIPSTQWYQLFQNISSELSGMLTYPYGGSQFASYTYDAASSGVDYYWNYGYKLVNAANGFIKNVQPVATIPSTSKQEMIAEAKLLRAFGNATLLLYYGQYDDVTSANGIILRNEFVTSANINLSRATVVQTYDSILSDLDVAIAYLPRQNSTKFRADVWTAKLLKARVLINRGQGNDYSEVVNLTNDIITNSPYSLESNVKDVFLSKAFNSSEVMLGIAPFPKQTVVYNNYLYYRQEIATPFMLNLFSNDPRQQWVYQTITDPYYRTPEQVITKYYPGSAITPQFNAITENGYAFRLTEAYLLEAEALIRSGGSIDGAKSLLKTVLGHAGVTDFTQVDATSSSDGMLLLIIQEEMRNFVSEGGEDWLALRRLPFSTLQSLIPAIKSKTQLILPIPQSEITTNNEVKQNPGY